MEIKELKSYYLTNEEYKLLDEALGILTRLDKAGFKSVRLNDKTPRDIDIYDDIAYGIAGILGGVKKPIEDGIIFF